MNLCHCRCGLEVSKNGNRFVVGHNNRGQATPLEVKKKISQSLSGKPKNIEHNRKVGEANKISVKRYFDENPDAKKRNSESVKKSWSEKRENYKNSLSVLEKYAQLRKEGKYPSGALGMKHTEEWKRQHTERMKKIWNGENYSRNQSQMAKERRGDKTYAQKVLGRREKTGPERRFEEICKTNNFSCEFVGNGKIRIGRWNPDFIVNGQNKVIEIFGVYFHKKEEEPIRIQKFRAEGFDCLVIWEDELKEKEKIVERVSSFIGRI